LAIFTPFNILANYILPLKVALGIPMKFREYLKNPRVKRDTKIYSVLIIGAIYFVGFFKVFLSNDPINFNLSRFFVVNAILIPVSIVLSFLYAVHELKSSE
jgi:hypothetical protein